MPCLHHWLDASADRTPGSIAVDDPGRGTITYGALDALSDRVSDRLCAMGVRQGDRVGLFLPKSIDSVAAIFGILKRGAAYIPVDSGSPAWRAAFILTDAAVRVAIVERPNVVGLEEELCRLGAAVELLVVDGTGGGVGLAGALTRLEETAGATPPVPTVDPGPDGLAYILYTSGSTGKPKGVMLTHRAATSFVDWCSETFGPRVTDVFSSHAPFHFDLSVHDLYVPIKHGARLILIGEELGKEPMALAGTIADNGITIWYSTPSILNMLCQYGRLPKHDLSALRIVLFAGEVYPVPQLRTLKQLLPHPAYYNLYGPTETNVCTWQQIPAAIPEDRIEPYPIGKTCSHLRSRVIDLEERPVTRGEEGELVIAGPGILEGYWNLPDRNGAAFLVDAGGTRWYRTGDLVVEEPDGTFLFHGRRDRMVKRRGYRIELGEIEAGLARHPGVREVAVVAALDAVSGVKITAFLSSTNWARPSIIALKAFCMEVLPRYMAPDIFVWLDSIPRTSTDKTDYQALKAEL